jgi:hypothetical protein
VRGDAGRLDAEPLDEPLEAGRRDVGRFVRVPSAVRRAASRLTTAAPANATAKAATIHPLRPWEGSASRVAVTGAVTPPGGCTWESVLPGPDPPAEPVPGVEEGVVGAVDGGVDGAAEAAGTGGGPVAGTGVGSSTPTGAARPPAANAQSSSDAASFHDLTSVLRSATT